MSRNYDNWERLVDAVLLKEKLRELALADSRSTSRCSSFEYEDDDDFNDSEYSNFNSDYINAPAPHSIVIKCPIANNRPSSQKAVIKIDMIDPKTRKKAIKIAARLSGVELVVATGEIKNELVVMGKGMDIMKLASSLRKKVGFTEIVSLSMV